MKVSVRIAKNPEKIFENYDDAMNYIETYMTEIESGMLNTDDIIIEYYGS